MAMFAVLGIALVTLLTQGMNIFSEGTADTSMQDRLQAILPLLRADLAAIQPVEAAGVPPPVSSLGGPGGPANPSTGGGVDPEPPANRVRSGLLKLADTPPEVPPVYFVAFVRTNGLEAEDPQLRLAGTGARTPGLPQVEYTAATVDAAVEGNMRATGGLLEVVLLAVPDDPDRPGMLTLYRLFRAPAGGPKSLLDPANFNSLAKIHALAAGHSIQEGVLDFHVTFRNAFATSWTDGLSKSATVRVQDGQPYVGSVWDSTRAIDDKFALYRGKDSLAYVRDDVFPSMARFELTLATPSVYGFTRGDTALVGSVTPDEKRIVLEQVGLLLRPGPIDRWLKVDSEWMKTAYDLVDSAEGRVTVERGQRGSPAREHLASAPVYVGASVASDVVLLGKDRYARRR